MKNLVCEEAANVSNTVYSTLGDASKIVFVTDYNLQTTIVSWASIFVHCG